MRTISLALAWLCVTTLALAQQDDDSALGRVAAPGPTIEVHALAPTHAGTGLSILEVQHAVEARRPHLLHCYEVALRTHADLAGTLTFQLGVSRTGTVRGTPTSDAAAPLTSVATCLARELTNVRVGGETRTADATIPVRITLHLPPVGGGLGIAGS